MIEIDSDVLQSPGFVILAALAIVATTVGYVFGKKSGLDVFPIWQLIIIYIVEIGAAYYFAARG